MFELITLHPLHHFILPGPSNNNEGISEIQTSRDPEYSIELREHVRKCLRPVPALRPGIPELFRRINLARKALRRYSHTIYSTENSSPHPELERVFYRGNEIDQMKPGTWEPSRTTAAMDSNRPESGFRNPSEGTIRYPRWPPPVLSTKDEEGDTDDSSIVARAERRIMAAGDMQVKMMTKRKRKRLRGMMGMMDWIQRVRPWRKNVITRTRMRTSSWEGQRNTNKRRLVQRRPQSFPMRRRARSTSSGERE